MQIAVMFGNPETTPGGKALKFYTSVRIDIRKIAQIKKGEDIVGSRTRVKVVKNKVAAPFRQTEFDILYGEGISRQGELLALGEKYKILLKAGSSYAYTDSAGVDHKLGRGYDAARTFLKQNAEVQADLMEQIKLKLKNEHEDTPPSIPAGAESEDGDFDEEKETTSNEE